MAANVLLGLNQGLAWSMTVNMKIDLVGPKQRGLATGFNEAAGYAAVGATALLTGYLATSYGLRPVPELIGAVFVIAGLGFTGGRRYRRPRGPWNCRVIPARNAEGSGLRTVFARTTWGEPSLRAAPARPVW